MFYNNVLVKVSDTEIDLRGSQTRAALCPVGHCLIGFWAMGLGTYKYACQHSSRYLLWYFHDSEIW